MKREVLLSLNFAPKLFTHPGKVKGGFSLHTAHQRHTSCLVSFSKRLLNLPKGV